MARFSHALQIVIALCACRGVVMRRLRHHHVPQQGQVLQQKSGRRHKLFSKNLSLINLVKDPRCTKYEMCKCIPMGREGLTQCEEGTCRFSPNAPPYCGHKSLAGEPTDFLRPSCSWGRRRKGVEWDDCEFANTMTTDLGPGNEIYTAITPYVWKEVEPSRGDPTQRRKQGRCGHQVLTDIDDTLVCSGGGVKGGVLSDCEGAGTTAHGILPGVVRFQMALAQGKLSRGDCDLNTLRRPIPFTARPKELKLILGLENSLSALLSSGSKIKKAFKKEGWLLNTEDAKYGRMWDLLDNKAMIGHKGVDATDYDQTGHRKFLSYKHMYTKHFKKLGIAGSYFVGDNGQGDLIAAQMMLMYTWNGAGIRAAFIHDALRKCDKACTVMWARYGVFVFRDYAQAAVIAEREKFIHLPFDAAWVCQDTPMFDCSAEREDLPAVSGGTATSSIR